MAAPSRATQAKRNRERDRQEKQQEKRAERALRKEQKDQKKASRAEDGSPSNAWQDDPDLAGIVPGPQPIQPD